eukprot:SAG11_NODE_1334_length_5178_cov_10.938374_2_plen_88_part_00
MTSSVTRFMESGLDDSVLYALIPAVVPVLFTRHRGHLPKSKIELWRVDRGINTSTIFDFGRWPRYMYARAATYKVKRLNPIKLLHYH